MSDIQYFPGYGPLAEVTASEDSPEASQAHLDDLSYHQRHLLATLPPGVWLRPIEAAERAMGPAPFLFASYEDFHAASERDNKTWTNLKALWEAGYLERAKNPLRYRRIG